MCESIHRFWQVITHARAVGGWTARGGARGASGPTRREDKSAGYPVLGSPRAQATFLEPKSAAATRPGTEAARLTFLEPKSAAATRPGTEAARLTFLEPVSGLDPPWNRGRLAHISGARRPDILPSARPGTEAAPEGLALEQGRRPNQRSCRETIRGHPLCSCTRNQARGPEPAVLPALKQARHRRGGPTRLGWIGEQIGRLTVTSVDRSSKATLLRTVPRPNQVVCKGFMTASGRNSHWKRSSTGTSPAYSEAGDARDM